jgi:hypothetical protein
VRKAPLMKRLFLIALLTVSLRWRDSRKISQQQSDGNVIELSHKKITKKSICKFKSNLRKEKKVIYHFAAENDLELENFK